MKRITVSSAVVSILTICFFIIMLSGRRCDECFSLPVMMVKFFACGLVIFTGSIYYTLQYLKNEKQIFTIETTPLLETNEVSPDIPASVEGTIIFDKQNILHAPYSGFECVYYHSITEKKVGSGKNERWEVVDNQVNLAPFYILDERGKLKIDPENMDSDFSGFDIESRNRMVPDPQLSEIDCTAVFVKKILRRDDTFLGIAVYSANHRQSEYILPPMTKIFAHGIVRKMNGEYVLRESEQHPLIISQKTKEAYVNEFYRGGGLVYLVHFLVALGFSVTVLSLNYFLHIDTQLLLGLMISGNSIIVGSIVWTMYNRMISLRQRAIFAQHEIDIELTRRSQLIPQIEELVKSFSTYELEVQKMISLLRVHAEYIQSLPDKFSGMSGSIFAIIEKYPEIKASDNFIHIMTSLVDTEERIAYARSFYNRTVRKFNTLVSQFPFVLLALILSMKPMPFISIVPDATEPS